MFSKNWVVKFAVFTPVRNDLKRPRNYLTMEMVVWLNSQILISEHRHAHTFFPAYQRIPKSKVYGSNGKGGNQCNHKLSNSNTTDRRRDAMGSCNFSEYGYWQQRTHCYRPDLKASNDRTNPTSPERRPNYFKSHAVQQTSRSNTLSCYMGKWNNLRNFADGILLQKTRNRTQ